MSENGINFVELYSYYACASLVVIGSCLFLRTVAGAMPWTLAATRFYEIPPLRLVFRLLHFGLWGLLLAAFFNGGLQLLAWFNVKQEQHLQAAIGLGITWLVVSLFTWVFYWSLVQLRHTGPPSVSVRHLRLGRRLHATSFHQIGKQQFPQMLQFGHVSGLWVRRLLVVLTLLLIGIGIAAATDWGREIGLRANLLTAIEALRDAMPTAPGSWMVMIGLSSILAMGLLYFHNFTYTLLSFSKTLVLLSILIAGLFASVAHSSLEHEAVGIGFVVLVAGWGLRWCGDVSRASHFRRVCDAKLPLQALVADRVRFLPQLRKHRDYQLPPIDLDEIGERISQGCRNVESADRLVTRNFARFLSLVQVDYEACASAMLRLLTVRRYVSSCCLGGTTSGFRNPQVPLWNEDLFPLRPPMGYANIVDPLVLESNWNIVCACGGCGGSGRVSCSSCGGSGSRTEYESYTEYSGGQSRMATRMVTRTCISCSGSGRQTCSNCQGFGRVLLQQTLVTQWQRLLPALIDPGAHIPDFMEDCEEQVHYQLPLVENRRVLSLPDHPTQPGVSLEQEMLAAGLDLAVSLPEAQELVEKLHDGKLYRADFQVAGFWTLGIKFRFLPGKRGWFFGARPEFHFPALPLSWGVVGTVLFVLPFCLATLTMAGLFVADLLQDVLPQLPNYKALG